MVFNLIVITEDYIILLSFQKREITIGEGENVKKQSYRKIEGRENLHFPFFRSYA